MSKNLFERADKSAWLEQGTKAMVNEKSNVLSTVAAFAFYALFAGDKAKKELHALCIDAGHYLPKKPDTVNQTFRNRVSAALALVEKDKAYLRATLEGVSVEDGQEVEGEAEAIATLIGHIVTAYTPGEAYPLTIANKFLPMLTADWSAEQCLAALRGDDMAEEQPSEADLEAEGAGDGEAEQADTHADKIRRAIQSLTGLLLDIPARDGESYMLLHTALDTFASAALKAQGVYDVVNQNGAPVRFSAGDEAIMERLAIEYGRATSYAAAIAAESKREQVLEAVQVAADAKAAEQAALDALAAKYPAKEGRKGRKQAA